MREGAGAGAGDGAGRDGTGEATMGDSLDPPDARLGQYVRVADVHADTGSENPPPAVPDAAVESAPGLVERFEAVAPEVGFRPAPPQPPSPPPPAPAVRREATATSLFDRRIEQIVAKEGGYTNDPADRGGETKWGITHTTARAFGYPGEMRAMTRETAISIYRLRYWYAPGLDHLEAIDPPLALKMLDWGVTSGPSVGIKALQRALNLLNREGALYPDITVDGTAGALTRAALRAFVAARGREGRLVLLGMITAQQSCYYMAIAETRPTNERFEYGWQLNRALAGIA